MSTTVSFFYVYKYEFFETEDISENSKHIFLPLKKNLHFLSGQGIYPPPSLVDMSAKNLSVFERLPFGTLIKNQILQKLQMFLYFCTFTHSAIFSFIKSLRK